jgi:glycosyltransferase involved in cell wall biosynthesis
MKILVITKSLTRGGAATGNLRFLNGLKRRGHNLIIYTADNTYLIVKLIRKIERVFDHLIWGAEFHVIKLFWPTLNLRKLIHLHEPDIVYFGDVSGNLFDYKETERLCVPSIHRLSDLWPYAGAGHYAVVKTRPFKVPSIKPDAQICPSNWILKQIINLRESSDVERIILRNSGPLENANEPRYRLDDTIRLGFISANINDNRKNLAGLLKILDKWSLQQNFSLQIYGSGTRALPGFAQNNGSFSKHELVKIFGQFDILIVPSLVDNSPNTIIEAFAHGVPVIANSNSGITEYINNRANGVCINFESENAVQDFNKAVASIYNSYHSYSRACITHYNNEFSPSNQAKKFEDFMMKLTKKAL